MSSISKAGIFIDIKQLLTFTDQMNKAMSHADREDYGRMLIRLNAEMVANFTLAYHRRDEKLSVTIDGVSYDIVNRGEKRTYVDALEASFDSYMTLMDFCFENNKFTRITSRKKRRKHKQYMELMAKISSGIVKWSGSIYKQVSVSKKTGTG